MFKQYQSGPWVYGFKLLVVRDPLGTSRNAVFWFPFFNSNTNKATVIFFFLRKYVFVQFFFIIYLFLAALGLCCYVRAFCSCGKQGLLLLRSMGSRCGFSSCGLRTSHRSGFSCCGARALGARASVVVACGLSCSTACGIFPDQGSSPCPLHW